MPATNDAPEVIRFSSVDTVADPNALVTFLEAQETLPGLVSARAALLDQLRLERARDALDVGCGLGFALIEMARRLPPGGKAAGVDISQTMIEQARSRASGLGLDVRFETGDAASLPFEDGSFDACRAERVLLHVPDPHRAIAEMTRVTRPGGRIAVLDLDVDTMVVDHPDRDTTRVIARTFADVMAQGWIGRQLPRLLRQAGLAEVSVEPMTVLIPLEFFRMLVGNHVSRLRADGVLDGDQADRWWSQLTEVANRGDFLAGTAFFLAAGTRP
jgi:ubiquinone/menaquinone biosynthesis C-methylase UbiE